MHVNECERALGSVRERMQSRDLTRNHTQQKYNTSTMIKKKKQKNKNTQKKLSFAVIKLWDVFCLFGNV